MESRRFSSVLSSAVLEWILMFFLFFDAFFSFLVTRFSRLCKLQTPCILCSRLDHVLGKEKQGFYWNLLCVMHKSEISSLAFCHVHKKLADVRTMCESCLLSFATEKKSNAETYRSLVGKLGLDFGEREVIYQLPSGTDSDGLHAFLADDVSNAPLLKKDNVLISPTTRNCSCCSLAFENKLHGFTLLGNRSIRDDVAEFGISLSSSTGQSNLHGDDLVFKMREMTLVSTPSQQFRNQDFNLLSHIGYSEVKINSDSESEVPLSDDGEGNAMAHAVENIKDDFVSQCPEPEPLTTIQKNLSTSLSGDIAEKKLIHGSPAIMPSETTPEKQLHVTEPRELTAFSSPNDPSHVLEEPNWSQIDIKADTPQAGIVGHDFQVPVEVSIAKDNLEPNNVAHDATAAVDVPKDLSSGEISMNINHNVSDPGPSMSVHIDLNDAYKLAVGARGNLTSPSFTSTEVIMGKDSAKVQEDLKLLLSQFSAARGLESPWHETSPSPRALELGDESILQNITKTLSLERNVSGVESLDGSIVSELEGENAVERLRRQIELDKKSISLLYKELEEERSASAIAANQTMAMITRLQEEKAAMHMEALQYQRLMEEQAEYDQDVLQKCNDMLTQREKEIHDLEAEVESYKKRFIDESSASKVLYQISKETESSNKSEDSELTDVRSQVSRWSGLGNLTDPLLCFEDEKSCISDRLAKLEKKLKLFSNYGVYLDGSTLNVNEDDLSCGICVNANGEDCVRFTDELSDGKYTNTNGEDCTRIIAISPDDLGINGQNSEDASFAGDFECHPSVDVAQESSKIEVHNLLEEKVSPLLEKGANSRSSSILLVNGSQQIHENCEDSSDFLKVTKNYDLVALTKEVSQLSQKLKAIEADRNFLEHAMNLLRNGNNGVRFIQEIAYDLRELRRIGISR